MKVPIEVEDEKSEVVEPDEVTTEEAGDESPETPEEVDEEA